MIVILTIFMISLFFQMFLLIFLLVGLSGIPALDLDSYDKTRFILTYCHLVRDKPVSSTFNLDSACMVSIGFFGESVCVKDPFDTDAFVEGTCLSVKFVRKAAKTFCAKTTTPLPTSTMITATQARRVRRPTKRRRLTKRWHKRRRRRKRRNCDAYQIKKKYFLKIFWKDLIQTTLKKNFEKLLTLLAIKVEKNIKTIKNIFKV